MALSTVEARAVFERRRAAWLADWTISVNRRRDGAVVEWRGMSAARLHNGRIVWWREYYKDPEALARAARD